jgi:hypothetical protein
MTNLKVAAALVAVLAGGGWLASSPARAESVMKECGAEWKAAKANNTTNGQTWKQYLADCKTRHDSTAATPAAAPAAAPAPTPTMAPAAKPATTAAPKPATAAAPTGAGQFANEAEAKGRCPSDTVVWVNTKSHKYHYAGHRSYGTTKQGAYMCEADAKSSGEVAAKGEKPKS